MNRGEVWIADLPEPFKRRPVLILSRDSMPAGRGEITVAYITSRIRGSQAEVLLSPSVDGMAIECVVNLDSINTIPKEWLLSHRCTLTKSIMSEVTRAIRFPLDLP